MQRTRRVPASAAEESVVRFGVSQRLLHLVVMVAFIVLAVTGMPQRFPEFAWSQWLIEHLGGIYATRFIHRIFAWLFVFGALYHIVTVLNHVLIRKAPLTMMLTIKDVRDAIAALRYDLGIGDREPRYDRYDFRQKFEYWGMFFGGAVMIVSGIILYFPVTITRYLPGEFIPAAKALHGYEGLMALLVIVVWHLYGAHFGPEKFPADRSIFSGRISRERMRKEHPVEYERLLERENSVIPFTPGPASEAGEGPDGGG